MIEQRPTRSRFPGHRAGTPAYRRLVTALMAGGLANFSLMYFVQPLLPVLAEHYQVSAAESAHALSVTTLAIIPGLLAAGPLADRYGRVAVMRWSLLASGILGLLAAFAGSWEQVVVLRGLLGLTLAGLPVAALAYLRDEVASGSHPRANASYIAGTAVGGALGRLLPGPLALVGGWPLAAAVMSGLTLAAGVALWVLLPAARGFRTVPTRLDSLVRSTLRAPRDPGIAVVCVLGFAAMGIFVGVLNGMPFRLAGPEFGLDAGASLVYVAYPVAIAAPAVARRVGERIGRELTVVAGIGLLAISVAVISLPSLAAVVIGVGLLGFAFLGTHSQLSGWVVNRARECGIGTAQASSAYLLTYYLGSTLTGAAATWEWQHVGWIGVEQLALTLAGVAGAIGLLAAGRRHRQVAFARVAVRSDEVVDSALVRPRHETAG